MGQEIASGNLASLAGQERAAKQSHNEAGAVPMVFHKFA